MAHPMESAQTTRRFVELIDDHQSNYLDIKINALTIL